jgi:hypothetical protein
LYCILYLIVIVNCYLAKNNCYVFFNIFWDSSHNVMKIPLVTSAYKYRGYDLLKTSYKYHLDVNECLLNSTCDANARCNNTEGSYTCTCDSGYSGDGISCDGMHSSELTRYYC